MLRIWRGGGAASVATAFAGDAHGRAPLFRPVIIFLPSRHRNKVDRFINRRGIIGLVRFTVPSSPIRAPLGRLRVGLMAEIPARENFKNTKTSKTNFLNFFGTRRKVVGKGRFSHVDFLPEVRK
jgi:hypothetical protein